MFFEEADELLATLEQGLASLQDGADDRARLDRVYRAAHSLKGAAAMVGYSAISELALSIERALGQVRSAGQTVSPDLARSLGGDRDRLATMVKDEASRFRETSQ
jgi:two-component system chemotaxis sensor kinase CheA